MSTSPANPPKIFNRQQIAARLQRFQRNRADFVTELVVADLRERLAPITRDFAKALIMGPAARFLPQSAHSATGAINFTRAASLVHWEGNMLDPENFLPPHNDYDLIVSLLDLQTVNDVPGFLTQIRRHLAPDGLMLLAAIGGNSFGDLRSAWLNADAQLSGGAYARVAPFIDVRDAGALMQRAGFALPVADIEHHTIRYASPLALMQEIRALGASNPLVDAPPKPATKSLLATACTQYQALAGDDDGRVRADLDILWLSGWAPHESQQKPLAPGSAEVSLKSVLENNKKG